MKRRKRARGRRNKAKTPILKNFGEMRKNTKKEESSKTLMSNRKVFFLSRKLTYFQKIFVGRVKGIKKLRKAIFYR